MENKFQGEKLTRGGVRDVHAEQAHFCWDVRDVDSCRSLPEGSLS